MTANKELVYWKSDESWFEYDEDTEKYTLTEKAPERARKSYEMYLEYIKRKDL